MAEDAPCIKFAFISFIQISFHFSYFPMTKRDLELPSAPRGRGKLRDCGVNSILTLVSVTMETCEWKPPLLTCELVVIARGKKKERKKNGIARRDVMHIKPYLALDKTHFQAWICTQAHKHLNTPTQTHTRALQFK